MEHIQNWILSAAVILMATVLGFIIKVITNQVLSKLDGIIVELQNLSKISFSQEEKIKNLQTNSADTTNRLNDHAERIVRLESKKD